MGKTILCLCVIGKAEGGTAKISHKQEGKHWDKWQLTILKNSGSKKRDASQEKCKKIIYEITYELVDHSRC